MAYLVLTVPNDLKAGSLLKQARTEIREGRNDVARGLLARIVQQFPRTDAAAAATVGLIQLQNEERLVLEKKMNDLIRARRTHDATLTKLQQTVTKIESTPPPAPIIVQAPPKPQPIIIRRKTPTRRK